MDTPHHAPLRVAAIGRTGRGDYGHRIDKCWRGVPGAALVAVADADPEGLARAVARNGLAAGDGFADWRRMLAAVGPDVVAICPRHVDCHAEMAIAAADAGARGIFMEKPFVRTTAEADAVVAACRRSGTKLALAFGARHGAGYLAARGLVAAGRIGRVLELRGRGKEDRRGGGEDLWVLGCHVLDMMVDLGGAPRWCEAMVTVEGRPITAADLVAGREGIGPIAGDAVAAMFGLADGAVGHFASVRGTGTKPSGFGLTVVGTAGTIHVAFDGVPQCRLRAAPPWRVDENHPWQPIGPDGELGAAPAAVDAAAEALGRLRGAAIDLVDAIATDREPETGMLAGLVTVEMTQAVFDAALSGRRIDWPVERR